MNSITTMLKIWQRYKFFIITKMSSYKICYRINLKRLLSWLSKVLGILFINSSWDAYVTRYKRLNVISSLKFCFMRMFLIKIIFWLDIKDSIYNIYSI